MTWSEAAAMEQHDPEDLWGKRSKEAGSIARQHGAATHPQGVEALAADVARHVGPAPPALPPTQLAAALSAVWRAAVPRWARIKLR